jgi:hypothetical protein
MAASRCSHGAAAIASAMRRAALGLVAMLASCAHSPRTSPSETRSTASELWPVRYVTVTIRRPPAAVYAFVGNPENLPRWAAGLAGGPVQRAGDEWIATAPMGRVRIRFAPDNALGVLDHDVSLEDGSTIHNPMRVMPNADGSEVVFALFRRPGVSDAQFAHDGSAVERDLASLKRELER